MEPRRKTWIEVRVGTYIQDKAGVVWKVEHSKPGFWGMRNRAGDTKIVDVAALGIRPDSPVNIMFLDQAEVEQILTEEMGAELMGLKYEGQSMFYCPPFEELRLEEMKAHVFHFHGASAVSVNDPGQPAGMNSKKALIECHEALTKNPGRIWTPHIHTNKSDQLKAEVFA